MRRARSTARKVMSATLPRPSVVRSTVSSCWSTSTPSGAQLHVHVEHVDACGCGAVEAERRVVRVDVVATAWASDRSVEGEHLGDRRRDPGRSRRRRRAPVRRSFARRAVVAARRRAEASIAATVLATSTVLATRAVLPPARSIGVRGGCRSGSSNGRHGRHDSGRAVGRFHAGELTGERPRGPGGGWGATGPVATPVAGRLRAGGVPTSAISLDQTTQEFLWLGTSS